MRRAHYPRPRGTDTRARGARDTHGVIFVIGSSEPNGEPLTRTPVSGARDTHGVIFVIGSSELTGEPLTRTPVVYSRGKEREYSSLNDHLQEDSPKTDIFTQESAKS